MAQFNEKVVFITGATSGIGEATAIAFAQQGANVVISGRDTVRGQKTLAAVEAAGGRGLVVAQDVADIAQTEASFEQAVQEFGRLDYLITSAGIGQTFSPLADLDTDEMHRVIDTNLKGTWLSLKYALPHLTRPGGAIVVIASLWGHMGSAGLSAYGATKAGVAALCRSLAVEQGPQGVRVNCISPGVIATPMTTQAFESNKSAESWIIDRTPLKRLGKPEEIAAAVVWLCSDDASFVTGQDLAVDGGITIA